MGHSVIMHFVFPIYPSPLAEMRPTKTASRNAKTAEKYLMLRQAAIEWGGSGCPKQPFILCAHLCRNRSFAPYSVMNETVLIASGAPFHENTCWCSPTDRPADPDPLLPPWV